MNYTIKNKKDILVNFGTLKGNMLYLIPKETKTISQEFYNDFEDVLLHYVSGGFVSIEKDGVKTPKSMAEKSVTPESQPKRKGRPPKKSILQEQVEANE